MSLKFHFYDAKGEQVFITPRITVTSGKVTKSLPSGLCLPFGYLIRAVADTDSRFDKTTRKAAGDLNDTLATLPADSVLTVHFPVNLADRESEDLGKFFAQSSVTLASVREVVSKINEASASLEGLKPSATLEVLKPLPVYGTPKVTKKGGGAKVKDLSDLFASPAKK